MKQAATKNAMIRNTAISAITLAAVACASLGTSAFAQVVADDISDVVSVTFLEGWREADGTHIAGLKFSLAPGWKTYWRAPGDGGVPTRVDLSGSGNLDHAQLLWPTPEVFRQNGLRSIGYRDEVIVPIALTAGSNDAIEVQGHLEFGVCEEICLPVRLNLQHLLPADSSADMDALSAALEDRPKSEIQAKVQSVECDLSHGVEYASIEVTLDMPAPEGRGEAFVIEAAEQNLWVSEPKIERRGDVLKASAKIYNQSGEAVQLDPSQLRFTVLTTTDAVDIKGCD